MREIVRTDDLFYFVIYVFDSSTRRVVGFLPWSDNWTNNRGGGDRPSGPLGNRIELTRLPRLPGPVGRGPRRSPEGHD